jgi:hypothetical protein
VPKLFGLLALLTSAAASIAADFTHASVVADPNLTGPERKAVELLVDAVRDRSRVRWPVVSSGPASGTPTITIRQAAPGRSLKPEGYHLQSFDTGVAPRVDITGNDTRLPAQAAHCGRVSLNWPRRYSKACACSSASRVMPRSIPAAVPISI